MESPGAGRQGEVEQISMMKPKGQNEGETGLLEYLEDIIGSHVYKERIEEAAQLLETLNEDRNMKLNRLKIGEKEVKNLEVWKHTFLSPSLPCLLLPLSFL